MMLCMGLHGKSGPVRAAHDVVHRLGQIWVSRSSKAVCDGLQKAHDVLNKFDQEEAEAEKEQA